MRSTKIVCTIGPAASSVQVLKQMLVQGMDVARFNMSHGTHQSHLSLINNARQAREELGLPLAILIAPKGPEIRVGDFENGGVNLVKGHSFVLTTQNILGSESIAYVNYAHLPAEVKKGTRMLLNDGKIELVVQAVNGKEILTKVVEGGYLSNKKAVNLPDIDIKMPYISEQDKLDIKFACDVDADYLAISFVTCADNVLAVKRLLAKYGKPDMKIISKIECAQGVNHAHEILEVSDGIMVARGDLGVEVDFAQIPLIQKELIAECNEHGKLSITATQMMESMSVNNRPTRAEISDVANAICDGT
ncbi:MAG: pyruvate kinase, partial [Clostridia bacterium]|nr:pyruvate kinase [Clostridia bacterium]